MTDNTLGRRGIKGPPTIEETTAAAAGPVRTSAVVVVVVTAELSLSCSLRDAALQKTFPLHSLQINIYHNTTAMEPRYNDEEMNKKRMAFINMSD